MGKGTIISGGTSGQYQVQVNFFRAKINAEIATLTARIVILTDRIAIMEDGAERDLVKLQKTGLEKRKYFLENNIPADETISAWCADLTEDLSGNVGTVEVPGERGTVLIQPGHEGNAVYSTVRDGQLLPVVAATAEQFFYNLAMFPGWQKWKPTFRFGTITAIDGDAANVNLEAATSSQQDLDVNQSTSLADVPIEYMTCDGGVFEVSDNVLIEFESQDWGSPKIIGFKDNPKACGFIFNISRGDGYIFTDEDEGFAITIYEAFGYSNINVEYLGGGTWAVTFIGETYAPYGYRVTVECELPGLTVIYPNIYRDIEVGHAPEESYIFPGEYDIEVPFFQIEEWKDEAIDRDWIARGLGGFGTWKRNSSSETWRFADEDRAAAGECVPGGWVEHYFTIKSSVPYFVKREYTGGSDSDWEPSPGSGNPFSDYYIDGYPLTYTRITAGYSFDEIRHTRYLDSEHYMINCCDELYEDDPPQLAESHNTTEGMVAEGVISAKDGENLWSHGSIEIDNYGVDEISEVVEITDTNVEGILHTIRYKDHSPSTISHTCQYYPPCSETEGDIITGDLFYIWQKARQIRINFLNFFEPEHDLF